MKRTFKSRWIQLFSLLSILVLVFATNSKHLNAATEDATAVVPNNFSQIKFSEITQSNATIDIKVDSSQNIQGKAYYIVVEDNKFLDDSKIAGHKKVHYQSDIVRNPLDPNISSYDVNDIVTSGEFDIRTAKELAIDLKNLSRDTNYYMYMVAENMDSGTPQKTDMTDTSQNNNINDGNQHKIVMKYIASTDQYSVEELDVDPDPAVNSPQYGFGSPVSEDANGKVVLTDGGTTKLTLDFSGVSSPQNGDRWVIEVDTSGNVSLSSIPAVGFVKDPIDGDNTFEFSTDGFPEMKAGFGGLDTGFSVSGQPAIIPPEWGFIRGVRTGVSGTATIRFKEEIAFTPNDNDIQIIDATTGKDYASDQRITNGGLNLEVSFNRLDPSRHYIIVIPDGTLARDLTGANRGLGQYNTETSSGFSRLLFFTEKKPSVVATYFNPGANFFNAEKSPFRMTAQDEIYRIPELVGVHQIGIGVNQALVVQFDDKVTDLNPSRIKVETTPRQPDLQYNAEISESGTELLITFDTAHPDRLLDFNTRYNVTIQAGAVIDRYGNGAYAQNNEITVSFKTSDGFYNAFIRPTAQELNNGIFQTESHNIAVDIPKIYIKEVETIHRNNGLISEEQPGPNLTNIDIVADEDVETINVVTNRGVRYNLKRLPNNRFSATYAGLNVDASEIQIVAYDYYGKVLERRNFKLQGGEDSEVKNDYVPEVTDSFGNIFSLYDVMKNPEILQDVLEQIPVSELDRIGVFYPYFTPYDQLTR